LDRRPLGWVEELDNDRVSIKGSVLGSNAIDHNIDLESINCHKRPIPIVRVYPDYPLEILSAIKPLLDLLLDLNILLEIDPLLALSLGTLLLLTLTLLALALGILGPCYASGPSLLRLGGSGPL
jgi:hypothetical protein